MQEANFLYNGKAKATSLCLMSLLESLENTIMKMGRDHRTIIQNINFEHGIIMRCGDRNFRQVIAPMFGCIIDQIDHRLFDQHFISMNQLITAPSGKRKIQPMLDKARRLSAQNHLDCQVQNKGLTL
jgi:hypothetical protein